MDLNIPLNTFTNDLAQELIQFQYKTIALSVPFTKDFKQPTLPTIKGLEILLRVDCTLKTFKPNIKADTISITVENEQDLEKASELQIDIITFGDKVKIKRKVANQCNKNGIVFELL